MSSNEQLISIMEGDKINIKGGENSSITIDENKTSIKGEGLSVEGDVSVEGDIKIDTSKQEDLPNSISVTNLYKRVQILESKLSDDTNDS